MIHSLAVRRALTFGCAIVALALAGCSASFESASLTGNQNSIGALHGQVRGGRQPIAGATIQLYAAGTGAYGAASTPLLPVGSYYPNGTSGCSTTADQASTVMVTSNVLTVTPFNENGFAAVKVGQLISLSGFGLATYLNNETLTVTAAAPNSISAAFTHANTGNTVDPGMVTPGCNGSTVTTDANGNFSVTGDYTCTAGTQVYLYSVGGNPGNSDGSVNPAAGLMAVLGQCPGSGTFADVIPAVIVNEASTVAAAYALAGFAVDATHVSAPSATSTLAATGIANAFANANQMYALAYGVGGALATTQNGQGTVPQALINSIANSLAACVNSTGSTSAQCTTLFSDARIDGTPTGTEPTDTASAAINIAHFPGTSKVGEIFGLAAGIGTPYQPALTSAPADFVVALQYGNGGMVATYGVAVDSTGSVWLTNQDLGQVVKVSNLGVPASGSPFSGGGLNSAYGPAIDGSDNAWFANNTDPGTISELNSAGAPVGASPFGGGSLFFPYALAIDGLGNVWVGYGGPATTGVGVSEFSSSGVANGSSPFTGKQTLTYGIAIDASEDVWIADYNSKKVTELSNAGAAAANTPFAAGTNPIAVAIDASGDAWVANYGTNNITALVPAGTALGSSPFSGGGVSSPSGIAIDGGGNVWVSNQSTAGAVSEFDNSGNALSPSTGYVQGLAGAGNTFFGDGIAIDGSGDLWVTSQSNYVVELIGAAKPVVTPLSTGVKNNKLGTLP